MMNIISRLSARNKDAFANTPILIACLGDSVTHGCFDIRLKGPGQVDTVYDTDNGYAAKLEKRLRALYPAAAVSVLNAGISGDSAPNGLKRLERDVLCHKPDLVTVNFGLNDAGNPNVEEGIATYAASMGEIFDRILASGAECILVTPNRMCAYADYALTDEVARSIAENCARIQNEGILTRYVEAAKAEAAKRNIPVADAYARWQTLENSGVDTTHMLSNYINHPTREAHDIFVDKLMDVLFAEK